jgi:membrane AbrB-like protein
MFAVTLVTLLFCVATGYLTYRQTGVSLASALLGSMPGGLSQMVVLCDEIQGTDLTVVTFMQTTRILAVVFIIPFIAAHSLANLSLVPLTIPVEPIEYNLLTCWPAMVLAPALSLLAYRLKWPTPFLLGPIVGSAVGVLSGFPAPPVNHYLLILAQIFVGTYIGNSISLRNVRQLGIVLPYAIGGALALVAFSFGLGYLLTLAGPVSLLTAFLSTAPGGMAEMGMTAVILHADISTVVAYQLFRLFSILLSVPPLLKWHFNSAPPSI